jgi:uncharacterized protein (TIGR02246 family)
VQPAGQSKSDGSTLNLEADIMNRRVNKLFTTLLALVAMPLALSLARSTATKPADSASADEAAIKQVVAGFSEGWNSHDAHSMCLSLADDVQWVNWRGEAVHSRKEVEDEHATLFSGLYKDTHRTDTVKGIRTLAPDLVSVDNYWTMTGAKRRDGSDWPYREGYVNYLMAKRNGHWTIIVSHTADFNAKGPGMGSK